MAEDEQDATTGLARPVHYPDRPITIPSPALAARYDAETPAESWARWRLGLTTTDEQVAAVEHGGGPAGSPPSVP